MQFVSFFLQFLDYKGNSSPARTVALDSVEGNTDAEQTWAKNSKSTSTKVNNGDDTTKSHVKSPDKTDENLYKDAIFRIGKVSQVSGKKSDFVHSLT